MTSAETASTFGFNLISRMLAEDPRPFTIRRLGSDAVLCEGLHGPRDDWFVTPPGFERRDIEAALSRLDRDPTAPVAIAGERAAVAFITFDGEEPKP